MRKDYNEAWTESHSSTVMDTVWYKAWETFEVVGNKGKKIGVGEAHQKERMRKGRKTLLWTLPWSSRGRVCACDKDRKPCRGWGAGEAVKWGLKVERSRERERGRGGRGERLNHRDRELECVRGFVLNVCFSGEWMMRGIQLHFLLLWRVFNWILLPLSQHFNTGLFSWYQPLSAQLLYGP